MYNVFSPICLISLPVKHSHLENGCLGGPVIREELTPGFMPWGGVSGQKLGYHCKINILLKRN